MGSVSAIKLISYVVVNLIAFMATLAFLDAVLAYLGARVGLPGLSFQVNDSLSRISLARVGLPGLSFQVNYSLSRLSRGSSSATWTEFSGK